MRTVDASGFVFGELDSLPGCSQIVVSHSVFANASPFKGQGAGKKAHAERLAYMRSLGWDYALCTVSCYNEPQQCILARFQWKLLDRFWSDKTQHEVLLYGKRLKDEDMIVTRGSTLLEKE